MLNILDEYLGNKSYEGSETILKNKQDQWKRRISSPYQGITYFFIGSNTTKYKHMYYQVVYSFIFFNPFLMIHFIFGQLLRKILSRQQVEQLTANVVSLLYMNDILIIINKPKYCDHIYLAHYVRY